jgi:hypothetical protein
MPDQLFTYYIENPLVITSINSGSWGRVMVIRLNIEIWEGGKVSPKRGWGWEKGGLVQREACGLLGFVALVCVGCISVVVEVFVSGIAGGWDCRAGIVYSWYSRLVSRW